MEKVPKTKSGIPGLDDLVNGGFNRGSIIVVSGGTGTGRSTFAMQFLVNGAVEYKEPGMHICFEENKKTMYENMRSYGWDIAALEKGKLLVFIDYPLHEVEHFIEQEGAIRDLIDTMGVERIVIDSITPFAMSFPNEDERRKNVGKLIEKIRKWDCTAMIIAEDAGIGSSGIPVTKAGAEIYADAFIHLSYMKVGDRRVRGVEVVKMRGVMHDTRVHEMKITSGGIYLPESLEKGKKGKRK